MNIATAYDYIDLLLDKANQPYFLNAEKDIFLNLSIKEFMDSKYALMRVNQDFSEMYGNRVTLNQLSGAYTIVNNYVELPDYLHVTSALLNGRACRILSDDESLELLSGDNPFKSINQFHPVCTINKNSGDTEVRLFFYHGSLAATQPDFIATTLDTFSVRYLRHLTVSEWDEIPEQYQHEIINIVIRKMTANIESSNYDVQVNEAQQ